jgi:hypothetical protein
MGGALGSVAILRSRPASVPAPQEASAINRQTARVIAQNRLTNLIASTRA